LTKAGEHFYREATQILNQLEMAVRTVREVAETEKSALCLGAVELADFPTVLKGIAACQKLYPNLQIIRKDKMGEDQIHALLNHQIDIGIGVPPADAALLEQVEERRFLSGSFVILVPGNHPLASKNSLSISDLRDQPLILPSREMGPWLYDKLMESIKDAGFQPQIIYETTQLSVGVCMVQEGLGIMLSCDFLTEKVGPAVVALPLFGLPNPKVSLFLRKNEESGLIHDLVEFLIEASPERACDQKIDSEFRATC
ncbi:MAG: LysR family substrate-binding domain-containing protein, partial [Pseudobdellovibrionaceae bacterium]